MNLLKKLRSGLSKTRQKLAGGLKAVLTLGRSIDEDLLEELEESLLLADVGPAATEALLEGVRANWKQGDLKTADDVLPFLKRQIARGKYIRAPKAEHRVNLSGPNPDPFYRR